MTTRANIQMREITPTDATAIVEAVQDLGLCSRGSGADNIRNVTGGATAGIDPQELTDTRPLAREWHFHVLNDRSLTGLPRKFNVAFDGGGQIATLEETNDIGFQAVRVGEGAGVEPGVWFRVVIGGITGHRDLARDVGVVCRPEECTAVADAIVRVVHRQRRPHRPHQGAAQVRARRPRRREVSRRSRSQARPAADPRRRDGDRRSPAGRPRRAYRRPRSGASRTELDRLGAAGRPNVRRTNARRGGDRPPTSATAISA